MIFKIKQWRFNLIIFQHFRIMFNLILCKITKEVLFATALILKKNKMETFKAVIGTGLTWDGNNETEEEKNIVDKLTLNLNPFLIGF